MSGGSKDIIYTDESSKDEKVIAVPDISQKKPAKKHDDEDELVLPPKQDNIAAEHWVPQVSDLPADRVASEHKSFGDWVIIVLSVFLLILIFPIAACVSIRVVSQYSRAVLLRLGRLQGGALGPGMFCVIPCTDNYHVVDMRVQTFDVPSQEVLTRDSVTVHVNAVVYYRISDPVKSILNVNNVDLSTQLLGQTTLRNVIGTHLLQDLISKREAISHTLQQYLDEATDPWGVKVDRVEIKDIVLPNNMQRAMAAEAEATREARAKVVAAGGERLAAKNLRLAADEMMKSPAALQLRYLQTLTTIAAENNSTIVFPMPVDGLGGAGGHKIAKLMQAAQSALGGGKEDEEEEEELADLIHLSPDSKNVKLSDPNSAQSSSAKDPLLTISRDKKAQK